MSCKISILLINLKRDEQKQGNNKSIKQRKHQKTKKQIYVIFASKVFGIFIRLSLYFEDLKALFLSLIKYIYITLKSSLILKTNF